MAHSDNSPLVGRSQGASIFWGLVSVFFAAAACFYFWKNHENEMNADKLRDEVLILQDDRDTLNSEKQKLQASMNETATELKTREDFLQEKEARLADEETRIEALAQQTPNQSSSNPAPTSSAAGKKFNDILRKLGTGEGNEIETRAGRPVLRVPNTVFFTPNDAALQPEGKALLKELAQDLSGQADYYELRVESFTDSDPETQKPPARPGDKPPFATSWDLTSARAAAIARFYRDQTSLPFQNVLVIARGDSSPLVTDAKENHARNSRVEISITPVPPVFHSDDAAKASPAATTHSLTPPPEPPAPAKKSEGQG